MGSYEVPLAVEESSLADVTPHPEGHSTFEVTYKIVKGGTKRGRDKLIDSHGFSYNQRRRKSEYQVDWECTVRSKHTRCHASVRQRGHYFTRGKHQHCHQPDKGALIKTKVSTEAKKLAVADVFKPAGLIIQDLLTEHRQDTFLPKPDNLIRSTNLFRQHKRPKDPKDLHFDLNYDYLPPNFVSDDVSVDDRRHLQTCKQSNRSNRKVIDWSQLRCNSRIRHFFQEAIFPGGIFSGRHFFRAP